MDRRTFLSLVATPLPGDTVPTDREELNAFCVAYNEYVNLLKQGVIDTRAWARVVRQWERLTR